MIPPPFQWARVGAAELLPPELGARRVHLDRVQSVRGWCLPAPELRPPRLDEPTKLVLSRDPRETELK
jgi:hypothetical protein